MVHKTPYNPGTVLIPIDPKEKLPPNNVDEVLVQFKHGTDIYQTHKVDTLKSNRIKLFLNVIDYWFLPIEISVNTADSLAKDIKDAKES